MRVAACSLAILVVFGPAPPVAAAATCPLNTLRALDSTITSSDSSRGLTAKGDCQPYGGSRSGGAGYNLTVGSVSAIASSDGLVCGGNAWVSTHDIFKLVGPASPSALVFTAQLQVNASGTFQNPFRQSGAGAYATLREGDSNSQSYVSGTGQPSNTTLSITVTRNVDESFDLYMDLIASTFSEPYDESARIFGTLSFTGLPAGYAVVSCQGYVSDPAVPVRATSWGKLKAIYR